MGVGVEIEVEFEVEEEFVKAKYVAVKLVVIGVETCISVVVKAVYVQL